MRNKLKRYYGQGDLHFLTFRCYRRKPLLGTARARSRFVKIPGEVRESYGFALAGYVGMPEHVHLLIGERKTGTPSTVLQVLKQRDSRSLRERKRRAPAGQLRLAFSAGDSGLPRFRHPSFVRAGRRFYDFNVWSAKKRKEKLEYMHRNPISRKLVAHPKDWPWSSWSFYEKGEEGLAAIDPVE